MEIKESNCLPKNGGGRSVKKLIDNFESEFVFTKKFVFPKNDWTANEWATWSFWEVWKSPKLNEVLVRSQQLAFITGVADFFSVQQSFTWTNDKFTLPLFKQTILFTVKPRLEIRKVKHKKIAVIFWMVFIVVAKIQNQMWKLLKDSIFIKLLWKTESN